MTVQSVQKDPEALTMVVVAEFVASVERVWQMWADPRLLEQWWGPPSHPATVIDHDLSPGGSVTYYMTGPEGEKYHGWWEIVSVDPPHRLVFEDGFADENGNRSDEMPTMVIEVQLDGAPAQETTMTSLTRFASIEAMEQVLAMGVEEGLLQSMGQIDGLLADQV